MQILLYLIYTEKTNNTFFTKTLAKIRKIHPGFVRFYESEEKYNQLVVDMCMDRFELYFDQSGSITLEGDGVPDIMVVAEHDQVPEQLLVETLNRYLDDSPMSIENEVLIEHLSAHHFDEIEYEKPCYTFDTRPLNDNIVVCSLLRPHTEKPFTVFLNDFQENGYEPFFALLFLDKEWGLFADDYTFLERLWERLCPGEYCLADLKERYLSDPFLPPDTVKRCSIQEAIDNRFRIKVEV